MKDCVMFPKEDRFARVRLKGRGLQSRERVRRRSVVRRLELRRRGGVIGATE